LGVELLVCITWAALVAQRLFCQFVVGLEEPVEQIEQQKTEFDSIKRVDVDLGLVNQFINSLD
jgi:hypothetical protein